MNTILLMLYLIIIVAPISNFIHELGHAFGAKLAKADRVVLNIGRGSKMINFTFRKIEIRIRWLFFTSGNMFSERNREYRSFEIIYITLFGPLCNAIVVFILYLVYHILPNSYVLIFLLYNGWLFLMNCIPFKIGMQYSDGLIMIKEILRKNVYK
ncbi:site-2 protease family protein [Ornithinibacillus scapharcae]|uniref:site-2 protease family protein n=1 Tax=Ornithinibacillus scapharcae TaxID=1147159 RepID=UPI000225BCC0|nr:site-2 protease family protein [Ornithinibacillus scapharcae]